MVHNPVQIKLQPIAKIDRPLPFCILRPTKGDERLAINNPIDKAPVTDPMLHDVSDAIGSASIAKR